MKKSVRVGRGIADSIPDMVMILLLPPGVKSSYMTSVILSFRLSD